MAAQTPTLRRATTIGSLAYNGHKGNWQTLSSACRSRSTTLKTSYSWVALVSNFEWMKEGRICMHPLAVIDGTPSPSRRAGVVGTNTDRDTVI